MDISVSRPLPQKKKHAVLSPDLDGYQLGGWISRSWDPPTAKKKKKTGHEVLPDLVGYQLGRGDIKVLGCSTVKKQRKRSIKSPKFGWISARVVIAGCPALLPPKKTHLIVPGPRI